MTELITRSFEIREVNEEERTVTGIAVPWDSPTNVGGYTEQFSRGAIESVEGTKLFWNHSEVIGKVISGRDTDAGYEIKARISDTTLGRDAHTFLKDGVIDRFSVGFLPVEQRTEENGTVTRTKVDLKEVSLVPFPAYNGATVSEVRALKTNANLTKEEVSEDTSNNILNTEIAKYDDSEIRSELDSVKRELAVVRENGVTNSVAGTQFRSAGELVKALASGDENASAELTRAYTGAQLSDTTSRNDWKAGLLKIVNSGRPVVNAFQKDTLGGTGMSVEYPRIKTLTGNVGVQVAEGDDLTYVEIQTETATAPVKTYGAYSQLSRQVIERTEIPYLQKTLEYQASSYAKVTNDAVRAAIAAATPQAGASLTLTTAKANAWLGGIFDALGLIQDNGNGAQGEFIMVSRDVFKQFLTLTDSTDRPVFNINGDGANTFGNAGVRANATVAGIPLVVDTGAAAKTLYVASSEAVTTWEAPGVPFRLDDENPINLTKVYSIYGYMAVGVTNPKGLVKFTIA